MYLSAIHNTEKNNTRVKCGMNRYKFEDHRYLDKLSPISMFESQNDMPAGYKI